MKKDKEIEDNIEFFTKCAIDYDTLATSLISLLIQKHKLSINWDLPYLSFGKFRRKKRPNGKLEEWKYVIHGFHFSFENIKTKQTVEASIVCGDQFGELDPMFFSEYILSTPQYQPLPIEIKDEYHDGTRILDIMQKHGILKKIASNWPGRDGIVLSTKDTSHIKPYIFNKEDPKTKFNLLRFLKLKR